MNAERLALILGLLALMGLMSMVAVILIGAGAVFPGLIVISMASVAVASIIADHID